jgi:hypothetical protein
MRELKPEEMNEVSGGCGHRSWSKKRSGCGGWSKPSCKPRSCTPRPSCDPVDPVDPVEEVPNEP